MYVCNTSQYRYSSVFDIQGCLCVCGKSVFLHTKARSESVWKAKSSDRSVWLTAAKSVNLVFDTNQDRRITSIQKGT